MQPFQKILVPTDGSASSDKAIAAAVSIADRCQGEIFLLYVSYFDGDTDNNVEVVSWLPEEVTGSVSKAGNMILENARQKIPEGILVHRHREKGVPSRVILSFSEKNDVSLIVMGGRGLGIVEGYLLGSVSQYVLENAKCPVMIVK